MAVLAKENGIPFYVAAPVSTLDLSLTDGAQIPIEERPVTEVTHIRGLPIAPEGVQVRNPSFDVTPATYITAIITEKGVVQGNYSQGLAALWRVLICLDRFDQRFSWLLALEMNRPASKGWPICWKPPVLPTAPARPPTCCCCRPVFRWRACCKISLAALHAPSPDLALNGFERLAGVLEPETLAGVAQEPQTAGPGPVAVRFLPLSCQPDLQDARPVSRLLLDQELDQSSSHDEQLAALRAGRCRMTAI